MSVASEPFSRRVHAALQLRAILRRVDAAAKQSSYFDHKQLLRPHPLQPFFYRGAGMSRHQKTAAATA